MHIIVIGAGIGGLSAALSLSLSNHTITLLESSRTLAEIGAGVQLTPNATKAFWKWGLGPEILAHSVLPSNFNIKDLVHGGLVGAVDFTGFEERYGAPYIVIHRADIHRVLHEHCVRAGVEVRLGSKVVRYEIENGRVELEDGRGMEADLVVACDGVHSFARGCLLPGLGGSEGLEKTGWAAYRKMAPVSALRSRSETESLAGDQNGNCWVGDQKLVMAYLVKGASMLNIVLSHRDNVDTTDWAETEYEDEIGRTFKDLNATLKMVLGASNKGAANYPVEQVKNLPTWISKCGRFVLMGDAAHAMAFYLSMGVSMAVEDAETLTECIRLMEERGESLRKAMGVFEKVRKGRAEKVRDASLHAGNVLQMRGGPERERRDRAIRDDGEIQGGDEEFWKTGVSYGIADRRIRDWCYGYDVAEEVQKEWF